MKTLKQTLHSRFISGLLQSFSLTMLFSSSFFLSLTAQTLNAGHQHKTISTLRDKVQQIYTSQIGIREKQPNSGPAVEEYLRYVNLPKGNPWCAAFVCWVYGQAGVTNPKSGWSPALFPRSNVIWSKGVESGKWKVIGHAQTSDLRPQTSDIFGLYFPEIGRIAHVGFIDQWDGTWLTTVEGNTNLNGSREGDGVYRKKRLVRSVYKVARYVD